MCNKIVEEIQQGTDPDVICGPVDLGYCEQAAVETKRVGPSLVEMTAISSMAQFHAATTDPQYCGGCALTYQSCCVAYGASGYPCTCHVNNPQDDTDSCGDCGCGWEWCCHSTPDNPQGNCKCPLGP